MADVEPTSPENDEFDQDTITLETKLAERFPAPFLTLLKKIANEVATVGLTEKEACMICDLDYARFQTLKNNEPLVRQLFERKNLEYKRTLLMPLSKKAKSDDKLAQWLLESRFPDDFSKKRRGGDGDPAENDIGAVIGLIQRGEIKKADGSSLIKETSGLVFLRGKGKESEADISVQDILKNQKPLLKRLEDHGLIPTK